MISFSRYVSAAGKAELLYSYRAGEEVTITDIHGSTLTGYLTGTGQTPDGEALIYLNDTEHVFAADIAYVE
jgi:hypothetical protein